MALRLPPPPERSAGHVGTAAGPVVLFLPAHDEEVTVAAVVGRVPDRVLGRRVECLVVDDGSRDRTAELAAKAGATVLGSAANRGLGAAVRSGLAAAVERGAAAVAFCDADGEYDPRELERLVAPILAGRADYVVGSRFAGEIRRMLPHRRAGNLLLTLLLRFVARAPIGDGQSGFRALSLAAAADAEILHDYNYAQVLTLDLLAKGYRYLEVPIGYGFRTSGRSFVRPVRYLRRVAPAVWRELNRSSASPTPGADGRPRTVFGPLDPSLLPVAAAGLAPRLGLPGRRAGGSGPALTRDRDWPGR
jgi:glycosyltransferase involved in cell wall biosynthesis